jgi:hypothetical protein
MPELGYVSHSTWERLNDKFRRNGRPSSHAGSMASCHTLSGILRCPKCGANVVGAGNTGYNCRRSVVGLCEEFRILDVYAEQQACEILDGVFGKLNLAENFEEAIQQERAAQPSRRMSILEDELHDLAKQEDRLADAIADGVIERGLRSGSPPGSRVAVWKFTPRLRRSAEKRRLGIGRCSTSRWRALKASER